MKSYISRIAARDANDGADSRAAIRPHASLQRLLTLARAGMAGAASSAQPQSLRIVERLEPDGRGAHLAQHVDLEARAVACQRCRHVAGSEALADTMTVSARGHVTDRDAVLHDR